MRRAVNWWRAGIKRKPKDCYVRVAAVFAAVVPPPTHLTTIDAPMKKLKLPEYVHFDGKTMKGDEAIELWLKADVPPEEIKKRLMVGCMLSPLKLRRLHKGLDLD